MQERQFYEQEYQIIRRYLKLLGAPEGGLGESLSRAVQEELTPRQRQLVEMYYFEQMRMQDIADTLGIHVSCVSRTLKRARERLRRCLKYGGSALLRAVEERLS